MQRYEPSATAHMVRKLLTVVVAFRTTFPDRSSITLFGCLDLRMNDLLYLTTESSEVLFLPYHPTSILPFQQYIA
jgi:hypothetical protein